MKRSFQTKSDMVYHRVREDIVSGVFTPGERLLISAVFPKDTPQQRFCRQPGF